MKKLLIFTLLLGLFSSCLSKNHSDMDVDNSTDLLQTCDLVGVWRATLFEGSPYFISFSESGRYTYCLDGDLMGSGQFELSDHRILKLKDEATYQYNELEVGVVGDSLGLYGQIKLFKQESKRQICFGFERTDEPVSPYPIGEYREPKKFHIDPYWKTLEDRVTYVTGTYATYRFKKRRCNSGQEVTKSLDWYYVYRKPYTYTQRVDGDGIVKIYDFDNEYDSSTLKLK